MPDPAGTKTRLPPDLLTDDARIDEHLCALDAALAGTARVRRPVVQELREFLLDARQSALQEGRDADAAATEAIAAAGSIDDIAREQRAAKRREFIRVSLATGIGYGLLMALFDGLSGRPMTMTQVVLEFVAMSAAFGLLMGALMTYWLSPSAVPDGEPRASGVFRAALSSGSRRTTYLVLSMFAVIIVAIVASLFGRGSDFPPVWSMTLLVLLTNAVVSFTRTLRFSAKVEADRASIESLSGCDDIERAKVVALEKVRMPRRLIHMPVNGDLFDLVWHDATGKTRRIMLPLTPEVTNGDRLIAWLETAVEENARNAREA